jgi:hypothetical protein
MSMDIRKLSNKEDTKFKKKFNHSEKQNEIKEEPKKEDIQNIVNKDNKIKGNKKSNDGGCRCLVV